MPKSSHSLMEASFKAPKLILVDWLGWLGWLGSLLQSADRPTEELFLSLSCSCARLLASMSELDSPLLPVLDSLLPELDSRLPELDSLLPVNDSFRPVEDSRVFAPLAVDSRLSDMTDVLRSVENFLCVVDAVDAEL